MSEINNENTYTGLEIAVIGAAGRFPGAKDLSEFWKNLKNGVESISFFSDEELKQSDIDTQLINDPQYIKAKGILEDIQYFDSSFFNYNSAQADIMDPQLRIYYECAWSALEDAGYNPETYPRLIGVYSGALFNIPWINALNKISHRLEFPIFDNESSYATRISYSLNLRGPSFMILSASATSLVAIHVACQGLLNAECDMALAGGVYLAPFQKMGTYSQGESGNHPGGHCRAFDAKASGAVIGEGVGIVVLKRLEDAEMDKDNIYAIIKGSAVNNDGSGKIGFNVPAMEGQAEVIRLAHEVAEVEPETISYIEAHGSSSIFADSIEIKAIQSAFQTSDIKSCALGSVKTNIGYLNYASGIAGFIKTILALKYKMLPPNLHFEIPNPQINLNNSPFYVNTCLKPWKSGLYPRRAGVKAFGTGGTNVYVVLEEFNPEDQSNTISERPQVPDTFLIPLSARIPSQLKQMTQNLIQFLKNSKKISIRDVSYTLQVGRKHFPYRWNATASSIDDLISALSKNEIKKAEAPITTNSPKLILLFSSLSSSSIHGENRELHWQLYRREPIFREATKQCLEILKQFCEPSLFQSIEILYLNYEKEDSKKTIDNQMPASEPISSDSSPAMNASPTEKKNQITIHQLHQFIFFYAMGAMLIKWGIKARSVIGQRNGEYIAAALRGNISLENALKGVLNQEITPLADKQILEQFKGIIEEKNAIYLEIGSESLLNSLIEEYRIKVEPFAGKIINLTMPSPPPEKIKTGNEYEIFLSQIGDLWNNGVPVNWQAMHLGKPGKRISLPTYPFEKETHWILETIK